MHEPFDVAMAGRRVVWRVAGRAPLRMIATQVVRTLEASAASGLVLRGGCFHVVADDENALFVFGVDGATRRIPLLQGELPDEHARRKAHKPGFESLVDLPGHGLPAIGSGSRARRERAVLLDRREHTSANAQLLRATLP